jgi:hypothetical protein
MVRYRWRITKDNLSRPGERSSVGVIGPRDAPDGPLPYSMRFQLLDDDEIPYYYGIFEWDGDEDPGEEGWAAPLDDYGTPYAGAALIRHKATAKTPPGALQSLEPEDRRYIHKGWTMVIG